MAAQQPFLKLKKIALDRQSDDGDAEEKFDLRLVWKNLGNAPASVLRIGIGSTVSATPPHVPMYRFFEGPEVKTAIDPREEYFFNVAQIFTIRPDLRTQIESGIISPWVWCEIRYQSDTGRQCEEGFAAVRGRGIRIGSRMLVSPSWRFPGTPNYTYVRHFGGR